ncbi:MAG: YceD family protein [Pseudomonadota bacterium]
MGLLSASRTAFRRTYVLADFERLRDGLAKDEGSAEVEFRFHAANEFPALEGEVRARPWLVCQRCLNPYEQAVESPFRVAFAPTEEASARVPEGYEGVVAPHGRAKLAELVEDELLLALPLVPMHASPAECEGAVEQPTPDPADVAVGPGDEKTESQRPFASLRELLDR